MTQEEQPPVTPEDPVDSGTPTGNTEEEAARTAYLTEIASTEYSMADHITYAQMIYQQPAWVVESVFASGQLDATQKYNPGVVQAAIDTMMMVPDTRYNETPAEGQ